MTSHPPLKILRQLDSPIYVHYIIEYMACMVGKNRCGSWHGYISMAILSTPWLRAGACLKHAGTGKGNGFSFGKTLDGPVP